LEEDIIRYSILIPAYNAQNSIKELITRIKSLDIKAQAILVVNDGSVDKTSQLAREEDVEVIDIEINQGKGKALRNGFEHYIGQNFDGFVVCLDSDLQHPPEIIPEFIRYARETDYHFIIGNRSKKIGEMPLHRILSNKITSFIISAIAGQKIMDSQCGYRMIHTEILKNLDLVENGFQLESEMILKAAGQGVKIGCIPVPVIYNDAGSHIGNVQDTVKFVWVVLKYIFLRKSAKVTK
jgi:glycosyltransferase involved in cell wall biosynthesis